MPVPRLIAHRGSPRECLENTIPSFLRAVELGADGIELDVHATRDGVVVVHHDSMPRAGTARSGIAGRPIEELEWDELRAAQVKAGRAEEDGIPRLGDVLDAVAGRAEVLVEIKGRGIEREVVETIRRSRWRDGCAVHAFDHRAVRRARDIAPELRGGILLSSYLVDPGAALLAAGALDLWMQWELIDPELAAATHAVGGRLIAWTVNAERAVRTLSEWRVDAICTDVLPVARRALVELA